MLFHLQSPEYEYSNIATILKETLPFYGVTVIGTKYWDTPYHHGYMQNPFVKLVEETYKNARSE